MPDMHQSMTIERVCRELHLLHGQVTSTWGRIEITLDGEKDACVLMSRAELDCLEQALEILCKLPGGQSICKELEDIAERSTHRAPSAMAAAMSGDATDTSGSQPSL